MFQDINEIVAYAKARAPLDKVVKAHLMGDKAAGRELLLEATTKAALAASLWHQTAALEAAVELVKKGKKTTVVKQWLSSTTRLMGDLPMNESGDIGRIGDVGAFVDGCNAAIHKWNEAWSLFDHLQVIRAEQRASSKPVDVTDTDTSTDTVTVTDTSTDTVTVTDTALAVANARIKELEEELVRAYARIKELETPVPTPARKTKAKVTT